MTEEQINELERLANEATPGPWKYRTISKTITTILADAEPLCATKYNHNKDHDAAYIVGACNAVPELIAENRALRERVRELERQTSFFLKALKEEYACPYSRCKYDFGAELDEWGCSNEDHQSCWIQAAKEAGE